MWKCKKEYSKINIHNPIMKLKSKKISIESVLIQGLHPPKVAWEDVTVMRRRLWKFNDKKTPKTDKLAGLPFWNNFVL